MQYDTFTFQGEGAAGFTSQPNPQAEKSWMNILRSAIGVVQEGAGAAASVGSALQSFKGGKETLKPVKNVVTEPKQPIGALPQTGLINAKNWHYWALGGVGVLVFIFGGFLLLTRKP